MRIICRGMATTLVALSVAGWTQPPPVETVLHSFAGGPSDGAFPFSGLIADDHGALYGTTHGGAVGDADQYGTVFKLTPPAKGQAAWKETVLYSFCSLPNCSDGAYPNGLTADKEGALYSTTDAGGSPPNNPHVFGYGTVFKLTPPAKGQTAWKETVLYSFCSLPNCSDGWGPGSGYVTPSLILDEQGALYGTTTSGGIGYDPNTTPSGNGTIFKLTPPVKGQSIWKETVLYSFAGFPSDGANPYAGLIADREGALYGTTNGGGTADLGTVFRLMPSAKGQIWKSTVLHSFAGFPSDGANPYAGLIADREGALYGTTNGGGSGGTNGYGTVFRLTPPAKGQSFWTETVLHSFAGGPSDGREPLAGLIADKEGVLYGTTVGGGTADLGAVFSLTPPAKGPSVWKSALLHSFADPSTSDGANPWAGLLIASREGALYSTTAGGGTANKGTVFQLALCPKRERGWREKGDDHDHDVCPDFQPVE
jgi:uncharacterized repeat protein (TIGR03803 family)